MSEFLSHIQCILSEVTLQEIQKAESYFGKKYSDVLREKSTYTSSIVARYLISKIVEQKYHIPNFLPQVDFAGKPIFETGIFWSIAHSGKYVFVGVSDAIPIGVDIEQVIPRDLSLFNQFSEKEWEKVGEKNWENFYLIWTSKEAVIKLKRGILEDISRYLVASITQKKSRIGKLLFDREMRLFGLPQILIYSHKVKEIQYTMALEKSSNHYVKPICEE